MATPTTIDSNTKVQLSILITILCTVAGGSWWVSAITEKVTATVTASEKTAAFSQRIYDLLTTVVTTQALHAKDIEMLRRHQEAQDRRIEVTESKVLK